MDKVGGDIMFHTQSLKLDLLIYCEVGVAHNWWTDLQRQDQESLGWEISIIAMYYTITLFSMAAVKQSVAL